MHTFCKITLYSPFSNETASCGLFSTLPRTDIFSCPKKSDTTSAHVWACSAIANFAISAEQSSLQLHTTFFFFNTKKEKMICIVFVESWNYKMKNKLKPNQNEFLIELTQICTYPKHLEFCEQHGQPTQLHPYLIHQ